MRSWYPVDRGNSTSLSEAVIGFNTSLYSYAIAQNVEEALQNLDCGR